MGEFSIHDLNVETQSCSPGVFPCDELTAGFDPDKDFMQQPFEMNFLFDEASMMDNHLSAAFSLTECQLPTPINASPGYSSMHIPAVPTPGLTASVSSNATTTRHQQTEHDDSVARRGSLQCNSIEGSFDDIDRAVPTNPWDVSNSAYERLAAEFSKHQDPSAPFSLPSRHTISRYIANWIRSFQIHLPFIHLPTNCFDHKSSMLLLTLAAVGSFYGFEHTHGYHMCFVAKSIVTKELEDRRKASRMRLLKSFPRYAAVPGSNPSTIEEEGSEPGQSVDVELLQSLLILVMSMSWLDGPLVNDALALSSQLSELTREALKHLIQQVHSTPVDWKEWATEEERRRTIYSAYFTLNVLTICFKVSPQLSATEIVLPLPSSEAAFKSPNPDAWKIVQQNGVHNQPLFHDCFNKLLHGVPLANGSGLASEFGSYLLMQGLLIQIHSERQATSSHLSPNHSLPPSTISLFEAAFSAWESCWGSAIDSAVDPSAPDKPLAFNSTAILRLAHIFLAVDLQGCFTLRERNPRNLARAFDPEVNKVPLQSPHLHKAVLHAVHALRIPIRVGIAFVARGRTGHWSVQHALSNFSCALLLTHWLESQFRIASADGTGQLGHEEQRLLSMIEQLIQETNFEGLLRDKKASPDYIRRLAIAALRVWAEIYKGTQVFEIIYVIGETLSVVADSLERRLSGGKTP